MPLYEYKCEKCEAVTTRIAKRGDQPPDCDCGGKTIQLISSPSLSFKSDGFYVTDYKQKGEGS